MKVKIRFLKLYDDPNGGSYAKGSVHEFDKGVADTLIGLDYAELLPALVKVLLSEDLKLAGTDHKAGAVLDLEAAQADILIAAGKVEKVADAGDVEAALAGGIAKLEASVQDAVINGLAKGFAGVKGDGKGGIRISGARDLEIDDDPFQGYGEHGFGRFAKEVYNWKVAAVRADTLVKILSYAREKDVEEATGASAGFLVPDGFQARMLERAQRILGLMDKCDWLKSIPGNTVVLVAYQDHDRSSTSYQFAGVRAYWVAEAAAITASDIKTREDRMELHKLAALTHVSNEVLEDVTFGIGAKLEELQGKAIGHKIVDAILWGTGAGMPLGAFNADGCRIQITKEDGQAAASIMPQNLVNILARLYEEEEDEQIASSAFWLYNRVLLPKLVFMTVDIGTAGSLVWLPANSITGKPYDTIWGYPARRTNHCYAAGTAGDICLGDYSQYLLATKGNIRVAMSGHLRFAEDQQSFRSTFRVGGQPKWDRALTPFRGSDTQSPFVLVETRA